MDLPAGLSLIGVRCGKLCQDLIADLLNALMSIPNLIAVLLLSGIIVKDTRKYINDLDAWDNTPVPVVDDDGNDMNIAVDTTLMK